jgi:hypothetical protein
MISLSKEFTDSAYQVYIVGISIALLAIVTEHEYSQTSLVRIPGDPPNCYSLSVVLANHID